MAAMEGGIAGLAVASGMAAINYSILTIAQSGRQYYFDTAALWRHLHSIRAYVA